MTSNLCPEDVVVRITTPQQIVTSPASSAPAMTVAVSAAGAPGSGRGAAGALLDLGRRLLLAARAGDTPLVLDLMAKGAPFTTDWLGTSALHLAAANAHTATCHVLLRAGVSRDVRTKVERTPLHLAAHAGHVGVAALLLQQGARADVRDLLRMTPLHWAAERGHAALAALLLRHGADPAKRSKFGATPAMLAAKRGHHRVLRELRRHQRLDRPATERAAEETIETPEEPQTFSTVQKLQEIKLPKLKQFTPPEKSIKIEVPPPEREEEVSSAAPEPAGGGAGVGGGVGVGVGVGAGLGGGAAALLRRHGITLLPPDRGSTVLTALRGGRTVVLSDAGKLMLKESGAVASANMSSGVSGGGAASGARGVVVRRGARLLALGREDLQQVRLSPTAAVAAGSVTAGSVTAGSVAAGSVTAAARRARPPVKIIMNKTNFERLVAGARHTHAHKTDPPAEVLELMEVNQEPEPEEDMAIDVGEDTDDAATLRVKLQAAQKTIARLSRDLNACRARLARYEQQ